MASEAIEGVAIRPLLRMADARGMVMRMLRSDDPHFSKFGEIYFSLVYPGEVKAWRAHSRATANYAVPTGTIRLVLFDDRRQSSTRGHVVERLIGEPEYCLVTIPPGVWSGFRCEGASPALVANCTTEPYDPAERLLREETDVDIPYRWRA